MAEQENEQSFPRAQRVEVGYAPTEDRLLLRLTLISAGGCHTWLTRRIARHLIRQLNRALKRSHPAAEGAPAADTVMALEHIAARSELAGSAPKADEDGAATAGEPASSNQPWTIHLISETRVEAQEGHIRLGLMGHTLTGQGLAQGDAEPVAGLLLQRSHAHEILRMLIEQAEKAEWDLEHTVSWLEGLTSSDGQTSSTG